MSNAGTPFADSCEMCSRTIDKWSYGRLLHPSVCGRCGRYVCFSCGGHGLGLGYGQEDEEKFGDVYIECYWELRESYAARWESEVRNTFLDKPYEITEEYLEFQEDKKAQS